MPKSVLFVEDHLELIDEHVGLLQAERPDWEIAFQCDIPSAWRELAKRHFDLVVIDVMLPAWPDVPAQSEGIALAKWILGVETPGRDLQKLESGRRPAIVFLTSRTGSGVTAELPDAMREIVVIERLVGDSYDHVKQIIRVVEQG